MLRGLGPRNQFSQPLGALYCQCMCHRSFCGKMPERCVVYGCSNTTDKENDIFLNQIPFWDESSSDAVKRRKKWMDFVRRRRYKWTPTRSSVVCSKHFTPECFEYYTQYWCFICYFTWFQPHQLPAPNQKEMHQNASCAISQWKATKM